MFEGIKNTMQSKRAIKVLSLVVAATKIGPDGFLAVSEKDLALLRNEPTFILVNEAMGKNEKGEFAVRASDAGIAASDAVAAVAATPAAPAAKLEFEIESGVALPATQRGGNHRGDTYPFAKLEVGQSFVVAATEAKPNPAKSLASTVSAATRRYKTDEIKRKFTLRPVVAGQNGEKVTGARVFRTQ